MTAEALPQFDIEKVAKDNALWLMETVTLYTEYINAMVESSGPAEFDEAMVQLIAVYRATVQELKVLAGSLIE